jgi:hypothetical protein
MAKLTSLTPHPRLYLGTPELRRARRAPTLPLLRAAQRQVTAMAERWASGPPLEHARDTHNEHLLRAREVQTRVLTLLTRWTQTAEPRYRAAVLALLRQMGAWEYWSWITWRQGNAAPDAIFDLSYGENSATLGLAYTWLYHDLTPAERAELRAIAEHWALAAARRLVLAEPRAWWFGKPDTNWNTVCAGGLGMLVLAMGDELPDATELLAQVEASVAPYFALLDQTNGAWPEGIGYWNYGMRYGFMYLLSHERATGRRHPLLAARGVRQTLAFPLDLCPHGQPCSFGDVNRWRPLPIHYAVASRLRQPALLGDLEAQAQGDEEHATWPDAAEWLLLHRGTRATTKGAAQRGLAKLYGGLDWAVLADRWPRPRLYLSVRGGTTKVPHGHRDLLSFHAVVGDEALITNLGPAMYLDTSFSPRREELFEIAPPSKNTLLVNGVGIVPGSALESTALVRGPGVVGVRLEATTAFGTMRDGQACTFAGRLVLLVANRVALLVDHVALPHVGLIEARLHTAAKVRARRAGALLEGQREALQVACASTVPAAFASGTDVPTSVGTAPTTVLRWGTPKQVPAATFATLLAPGREAATVALTETDSGWTLTLRQGDWRAVVAVTRELRLG